MTVDDRDGIRISDEQREGAVQEIREHYAAGRLSDEELSDRVQAAYRAKTEQDLAVIRADLPRLPASPAQQRAEIAERRHHLQRRLLQQSGGSLMLFAVCTVIWAVSGSHGHGQFWPIWVGLVAVLALLRDGWRLYGPAPELDRVEHELARREDRAGRRGRRRGRLGP